LHSKGRLRGKSGALHKKSDVVASVCVTGDDPVRPAGMAGMMPADALDVLAHG